MSRQLQLHLLRKSDTVNLKARTLGLAGRGIHKHKRTPRHTGSNGNSTTTTTNTTTHTNNPTPTPGPTSNQPARHRVRSQLSQRMKWATVTETASGIDPDTIPATTIPALRHAVREESPYSSLRDDDSTTPTTSATDTTPASPTPSRPPWTENPAVSEPAKYLNSARRQFIRRTLSHRTISTTTSTGTKELSTSYQRIAYIERHTSRTTGTLLAARPDFFFTVGEPDPTRTHWTDRSPPPRHEAVPEWYRGETSTIETAQDWKKAGETVRGNPKLIWKRLVRKRVVKRLKSEVRSESGSGSGSEGRSDKRSGSGAGSGSGAIRRYTPGSPGLMTAMRRRDEAKALKEALKRAR
ncbi:hypothetical protein ABEF95_002922 [Exophiala dermatitidis]